MRAESIFGADANLALRGEGIPNIYIYFITTYVSELCVDILLDSFWFFLIEMMQPELRKTWGKTLFDRVSTSFAKLIMGKISLNIITQNSNANVIFRNRSKIKIYSVNFTELKNTNIMI